MRTRSATSWRAVRRARRSPWRPSPQRRPATAAAIAARSPPARRGRTPDRRWHGRVLGGGAAGHPLFPAAVAVGCAIVNDVNAFQAPGAVEAVASADVGVVIMHMQGTPQTMQQEPHYDDVVAEVGAFLRARAAALEAAGLGHDRIALDPGVGFGKKLEHNLALFP